jgi:hypothetical protein
LRHARARVRAGGALPLCGQPQLHAGRRAQGGAVRAAPHAGHRALRDRAVGRARHRQPRGRGRHRGGAGPLPGRGAGAAGRRRCRAARLAAAGFRGVRFNFMRHLAGASIDEVSRSRRAWRRRPAPAGAFRIGAGPRAGAPLARSAVPVVIDHMGRVDAGWARTMPISARWSPAAQPAVPREGERHRPHRLLARRRRTYMRRASSWRGGWSKPSPTAASGAPTGRTPTTPTCRTMPRWSTRWSASRPRPPRASSCWSPIPPPSTASPA